MKTTFLICIALLFGLTISAQNIDAKPDLPYATHEYKMMSPDYNDPQPWSVIVTKGVSDYNDPLPWCVYVSKNMSPDAIPALGYPTHEKYYVKPPASYLPNSRNNYNIKVRKPQCCVF